MKKKLILIASGQTCNKFWTYSNYLSNTIDKNEQIIIFAPFKSILDYPNLLSSSKIKFPFYSKGISKIIGNQRYISFLQNIFENKFSKIVAQYSLSLFPTLRVVKASVGSFQSENFQLKSESIKTYFTPNVLIINEVELVFKNIKTQYDLIIGIHIRRGDYKDFSNGIYYYSLKEYKDIMNKAKAVFPNKSVGFFIASNERVDLNLLSDYNCFVLPNGSASHDLYALGLTDYIIGPPSTFSGWASFYANVPLLYIENTMQKFELNDFRIIRNNKDMEYRNYKINNIIET